MMDGDDEMSLQRALTDLEIITSAYEEEVTVNSSLQHDENGMPASFPIQFTLQLSSDDCDGSHQASVTLELNQGYPTTTGVQIASYQCSNSADKKRMEITLAAIRQAAMECMEDEIEGSLTCCSVALQEWADHVNTDEAVAIADDGDAALEFAKMQFISQQKKFEWVSGEPIVDKKSTFQAHLCRITEEEDVSSALRDLIGNSSKLQRASHNMYAWRVVQENQDGVKIYKHDNDDDGESSSGSKLAYLLDMRKDENVLVVVSRWYGGIHLGSKRFAHIINVARDLLTSSSSVTSSASR